MESPTLFQNSASTGAEGQNDRRPLAERMRPSRLEDFVGQTNVLGVGKPLRTFIERGEVPSLILWGPPGTGKSSLARLIGRHIKGEFVQVNSIDVGAKALREIGEAGRERKAYYQTQTLLFIDEIHRLNKAQQDVLLPFVERGDIFMVGATTENPSFSLNPALQSRCRILVLERLGTQDFQKIWERVCADQSLDSEQILTPQSFDYICQIADGDARRFLNLVDELLVMREGTVVSSSKNILWPVDVATVEALLGQIQISHSRTGDDRYDLLSAMIKSIRGSDPDAGLYYFARLIEGGEDPRVISRRLMILASEDVGNADPKALEVAVSGHHALEAIGLPEAAINLAQVVTYLACAPKSNRSYLGLRQAQESVRAKGKLSIPLAILNAPTTMMKNLGYGKGYKYAHSGERGWQPQEFLPRELQGTKFYEPSSRGFEKRIREYLDWVKSPGSPETQDQDKDKE